MGSRIQQLLFLFLFCTGFSFLFVKGSDFHKEPSPSRYTIDAFQKLLVALNITKGPYMSKDHLERLLDKVTSRYVCETSTTCSNALCLSTDNLIRISTGHVTQKLSREQFYNFALVLLYRLQKKDELCKTPPDLPFLELEKQTLALLTDEHQIISPIKLDEVLHRLTGTIHHEDHDHDHNHDHEGHNHDRHRRSSKSGEKIKQRQIHDPHFSAFKADHHEHDHHEHDGHEHDDHEDEIELPALYKDECFNAELAIDQSNIENEGNHSHDVKKLASVIVYHLYKGTVFDDSCRILPTRTAFLNSLFQSFHAVNGSLTLDSLKEIIKKLGIGSSSNAKHEAHDHDHAHKRRSLDRLSKRAAIQSTENTRQIDKCFSDMELLSVFTNQPKSTIGSEVFTNLCPALIQQHVSGVCQVKPKVTRKVSTAESYGYGTLCVLIICFCSVVGALVVVCKNRAAFMYTMALFEGLAVGTLTSDALIHLIPEALGLHKHGDEQHGPEENSGPGYLWFCLACLGGVYIFYLLELLLTFFHEGHGHSHDFTESQSKSPEVYTVSENSKAVEEKTNSEMNIGEVKTEIKQTHSIPPLALMVVIGDALHNFADGLAIGAAFNQSLMVGFATSLAVLCHELPHELGDFGVLLGSGIGFKRAIFFNLFSSLTALIGLYIGLIIATDIIIRQWIFAITSGMFLYISLVDLLPLLKSNELRNNKGLLIFSNFGILCGVGLMLIIGIYEEDIKFSV